jgi:cold-inducible RNA-binding protein
MIRRGGFRSDLSFTTHACSGRSDRQAGPLSIRTRKARLWVRSYPFGSWVLGKKLYVGNLSFRVASADLEQIFSEFGEVTSAQVVEDRETGRSRGFGFVEMGSDAAAQAAIDGLHDQEFQGRRLTVNEAKPREPRAGGGGGYGGGGGGGYGGGGGGGYGGGGGGRSGGGGGYGGSGGGGGGYGGGGGGRGRGGDRY